MSTFLKILLWIVGIVGGALVFFFIVGLWAVTHPEYTIADGRHVRQHVAGRWDWSTRKAPCTDSAHVIAFAPDFKTMTITQERAARDTAKAMVTTYEIVMTEGSTIRGAIRGETRMTAEKEPVVWDLVLTGPNQYRWHRTDWSATGFTPPIVRCGAEGPVTTASG
jgi:hypothetical protein